MRTSSIGCIVLSLALFAISGCGGDNGEVVGKEYNLALESQNDDTRNADGEKKKQILESYKTKLEAIEARYSKLSPEEKKKAEKFAPALKN